MGHMRTWRSDIPYQDYAYGYHTPPIIKEKNAPVGVSSRHQQPPTSLLLLSIFTCYWRLVSLAEFSRSWSPNYEICHLENTLKQFLSSYPFRSAYDEKKPIFQVLSSFSKIILSISCHSWKLFSIIHPYSTSHSLINYWQSVCNPIPGYLSFEDLIIPKKTLGICRDRP